MPRLVLNLNKEDFYHVMRALSLADKQDPTANRSNGELFAEVCRHFEQTAEVPDHPDYAKPNRTRTVAP